jgi:cation diffusion facilitator CzcD-associated flavoprotein CzcO
MCLVPDGDLFEELSRGRISIVTDTIETFTETGVQLSSGTGLEADIIVTATGLSLLAMGGAEIVVDGHTLDLPGALTYRGMMLSDVPNAAFAFGYTNASWTLKCDLTCEYLCRLLNHMDANGYSSCVPHNRDASLEQLPFADFNSGYILRAIENFPKQGSRPPWRLYQNYARDILLIRRAPLEDGVLEFSRDGATGAPSAEPAVATAA